MNNELVYILWYHRCFGKTLKGRKALKHYGGYKELYDAVFQGNEETGLLKSAPSGKYTSFSTVDAEKVLWTCEDNGWQVIPCTSPLYPGELLEISDYPHILFADGNADCLNNPVKFAVVGSREASDEAIEIACNSAYNLAKTGAVIVSGAALGIDSAAHLGAIKGSGATVGVLGCGLGNGYMQRIGRFYDEVKLGGVYITEMFPFEDVSRNSFPDRNRIISGLSRAVLVACASKGSGSLNTANHAKKQKRRIYVPGPEICYSSGCEQLLNEGAYTFYNAGDMAYPFKDFYADGTFNENYCNKPVTVTSGIVKREDTALPKKEKRKASDSKPKQKINTDNKREVLQEEAKTEITLPDYLSDTAKAVYEQLSHGALIADDIAEILGFTIVKVQIAVCELEAENLIKTSAGGRIERK